MKLNYKYDNNSSLYFDPLRHNSFISRNSKNSIVVIYLHLPFCFSHTVVVVGALEVVFDAGFDVVTVESVATLVGDEVGG